MMRYYIEEADKPLLELKVVGIEGKEWPEGFREPTLLEKYELVENSSFWDDFEISFYEGILEELDIEFDFTDEDANWDATWDEVTKAIEDLKKAQESK